MRRALPRWFTESSHLLEGKEASSDRTSSSRHGSRETRLYRVPDAKQPTGYRLAKPGEMTREDAEPYTVWGSDYKCFQEIGPGVSLYFRQVMCLSWAFLVAGLVALPSIAHNISNFPWTWAVDKSIFPTGTMWLVLGTAGGAGRDNLSFEYNGIPMMLVAVVLAVACMALHVEEKRAVALAGMKTYRASSYTVCITNPLEDIRDPQAYATLLSTYGEVVMVSMILDNGRLLQHLVKEKEYEKRNPTLKVSAFKGVKITWWKAWLSYLDFGTWGDAEVVIYRWSSLADKTDQLVEHPESYKVQAVYVVFNSEISARACLMGMRSGLLDRSSRTYFHGRVLKVVQPEEPTEVIWENLQYTSWQRWMWRAVAAAVGGAVVYLSYLVQSALTAVEQQQLGTPPGERNNSLTNARIVLMAPLIIAVNNLLPYIMTKATNLLEVPHSKAESRESITSKTVVGQCINTTFILYLVTPYAQMLRPRSIACAVIIMLADCFYPLIKGSPNWLQRPLLASLIRNYHVTLEDQPETWDLAERYASLVNTTFLGLFFAPIIPTALFITSLALASKYWVDKARLFRSQPPPVDRLQPSSVRDFLSVCLLVHILMARSFFANWPFHFEKEQVICGMVCYSKHWLLSSQWKLVRCYGVLLLVPLFFIMMHQSWGPVNWLWSYLTSKPSFCGEASDVPYRSCRSLGIPAYVPVIPSFKSIANHHSTDTYLAAEIEGDLPVEHVPVDCRLNGSFRTLLSSGRIKLDPMLFSKVKYYSAKTDTPPVSPTSTYGSYALGFFGRFWGQ